MGGPRVALVTGGNKGIGFEIAKCLAKDFTVVLGCRDVELGNAAAEDLRANYGLDVSVERVDLTEPGTWDSCVASLTATYGRLDVLVNNGAICYNDPTLFGKVEHTPFDKQAEITVRTFFFGTLGLTRACLLLLRAAASPPVINLASHAGRLSIIKSPELRAAVSADDLDIDMLEDLMRRFVKDAEAGTHAAAGWPNTGYGVSKVGVIAMTRVLARDEPGIAFNTVDPGYCATDKNANHGHDPASLGAETSIHLAGSPEPASAQDQRELDWTRT